MYSFFTYTNLICFNIEYDMTYNINFILMNLLWDYKKLTSVSNLIFFVKASIKYIFIV